MAAHDLINAAIKANDKAMKTAIKNGYPVQLPANQYLPKAMNGNIDLIHLGQFADLDAGFDDYRKQQAAQQAQAANQDFSDLDAGFAEWSAGQGGANTESMRISPVEAPKTASTSMGGQSTGSRSGRAYTGRGTAQEEIPSLDNMAVPVTAKTTTKTAKTATKAEKKAEKEVKQANSTLSKADKALQTAQKKQTVAENNLRKKLDKAENEAQKADAAQNAVKVTKRGKVTVVEPAQNVQQTKRKMQNLAKEEARAQAEYTKAQNDVRKAEERAKKAADKQAAANDRAQAVSAFAARRTANSGTVSSAEQVTNNAVRRDIIDQAVNNQISSYNAMPKASAVRGASGRVHSGNGRTGALAAPTYDDSWVREREAEDWLIGDGIPVLEPTVQSLVPTDDVRDQIQQRQAEAREATNRKPTNTPEMSMMQSAVRGDALRPQQSTSRLAVLSDPNRRLTKEEQAEAEQIIRDYNREHGIHGGIEGWYDGPDDPLSPEYLEYAAVQRLKAKTTGGAIGSGISDAYNLLFGTATEGADKLADFVTGDPNNNFSQSIRQANDLRDQTMQASQVQAPLAYAGGNLAGKMLQYMGTEGIVDAATGALGITNPDLAFWANQGVQNLQDYALNEIPDLIDDLSNGVELGQALQNFGKEAKRDFYGNLIMGTAGDIVVPALIERFGKGAVDAAESVADAERAVSNTPAPVDDSVDAALYGTGIMQDLTGGSRADIPELGRPFQERNLEPYQWEDFYNSFTDTDAGGREGSELVMPYVRKVWDYDAGRATLDDVDEAFNQAQFELGEARKHLMDPEIQRIINPDYSGPTAMYDHALRKFGEKYPEQAGAYRQAQDAYNAIINNPEATREEIVAAHEQLVKAANGFDGKIRSGEAAPRKAELNQQIAELKRSKGADKGTGNMKVYADPEWVEKRFGTKKKTAQERLKGTNITLVDDPRKASKNIPMMGQSDLESFLADAIRMQSEKNGLEVAVNTHIGAGKDNEKISKFIYSEIAEKTDEALKSHGYWGLDELSPEQQAIRDFEGEEWAAMVENWPESEWRPQAEAELRSRLAEIRGIAPEEVESPYLKSIAEDAGVPNQTDEVLNIGADEIPSATRQAAEATPVTAPESIPELAEEPEEPSGDWRALFDDMFGEPSAVKGADEAANNGVPLLDEAADEAATIGRTADEATSDIPLLEDTAEEVTDVARANGNGGGIGNGTPQIEGPVGRTKTSKAYTNTGKRGGGWNETEYKTYTDARNYQYESISEKQSVEDAIQMTIDEGPENLRKRLLNTPDTERLSSQEIDALMMQWRVQVANARAAEAMGEDASEMWKESNRIFKKIQTESTHNAQAVQALAKWSRNTPEGLLAHADNVINGRAGKVGRAGRTAGTDAADNAMEAIYKKIFKGKGDIELSGDFQREFLDLAERLQDATGREREEIMAQLGKLINKQIPAKVPEKIKTYLMDSMLGNFRTLITRNAGGNVGFNAVEQTAERPLAALIDSIIGKKTGRRTQAGLSKAAFADYLSGFKKGLADEWADFKTIKGKAGSSIHTARSGESTLEEAIANNRQVFSTFLFDKADQLVKHGLSVGDRPFYEAVYKETLGDYTRMYKAGKMGKDIQSLPEDVFKQYAEAAAKMNALAACYQDDSALAKGFMELRNGVASLSKGLTGVDILSQFAMPFVKTPANIINRAVEYSPLGIFKNAVNTAKDLKANAAIAEAAAKRGEDVAKGIAGLSPAQQNRLANETARNILGTGLFAGGIAAADKGLISGGFSKDKDEAAIQRSNGMQEYALHKDDAYRSIDWIPVLGNDLVAAAAFQEAMENSEGTLPEQLEAGLAAGLESQFDTSMLQGLENLFSSNEYNRNQGVKGIVPNVVSTIKSGATQAIPSLVRQAAAFGDDYKRQLGGDDPNDYYFNSVKNAIPWIRETLEPKVDNQGELVEQNAGRNAFQKFFDNFLSPWTTTYEKHTPLDEEAKRLSDSTGSDIAFVTTPQRSDITTDDFTPSDKDFTNYRQEVGALKKEIGEGLIQSDFYQQFSDADKAVALQEVYSAAKAVARKPYVKIDPTTRYPQVYERSGLEGVLNYINANVNSKKLNFKEDGTPVGLSQASTRGKFDALAATGYDEETQGRIYYDSLDADDRENLKGLYKDAGDVGMYQFMRGKVLGDADANSSMSIQEVMDYGTTYPEVSDEVISKLMPKHSGTFKREGDVWNYYDKNGKLTKSGSVQQYDYEVPEIDYSIARGPVREAEEETAVEEPAAEPVQEAETGSSEPFLSDFSLPEQPQQSQAKAASKAAKQQMSELRATQQPEAEEIPALEEQPKPVQQTASNVEINPATGRPVAPTRQTAQAEPAVEIDPRTGRPKAPSRSNEVIQPQGEIPKLEPNGNATWNNSWEIENSKSWGRFRQIDPSYTTSDYARVYNAMDKDKNGKLKSAEIQNYLNAMSGVDDAYRWAMFNAFANQGWGNPYKK